MIVDNLRWVPAQRPTAVDVHSEGVSMQRSSFTDGLPRRRAVAALALAIPLTLAGCGGGDPGGATAGGGGDTTAVTVGVIPILDVAPLYLGIEQGFFTEERLELTLETAQGGAAIVPGVVSGQYQFGFSNVISLLLGASQGLPLKAVANGVNSTGVDGRDFGAVVVPADSPIQSAADLAGKRVAVNTLKNINTTTTNEAVRQAGGDPSGIEYVELPFPEIPAAVASGDVDAGQVVEPFLTIATQQGQRQIASNLVAPNPNLPVALYFTSAMYAQQNPEVVAAFTRAMTKSLQYAQSNPDAARAILSTYTKIEPAVQEAVTLPAWSGEIDRAGVQKLADLAVRDGLLPRAPDLSTLLP
jgi:NitT/TauT family transport system substrate-binding protein